MEKTDVDFFKFIAGEIGKKQDSGFYGHLQGGQKGNVVSNNPHAGIKHLNPYRLMKGINRASA